MLRYLSSALCLYLLAMPVWSQQEACRVGGSRAKAAPEKILVVGQRPGPGLWKISKGDHVLWVFGTYGPLPKKMEWRSHQVEAILAQSQEYLLPPSAQGAVFQIAAARCRLQSARTRIRMAPRLKDVLPPPFTRAGRSAQREVHSIKDDSIERRRPIFAAQRLFGTGDRTRHGLGGGRACRKRFTRSPRKTRLKMTRPRSR